MNIYQLQDNEHQKILHLLQLAMEAQNSEEVGDLFNRFRIELSAHKIAEEQTLFKFLAEQAPEFQTHIENIKAEHAKLEEIFNRLRHDHDLEWDDLAKGLQELREVLQHDFQGEEQLLAQAKDLLSAELADSLARDMSASKLDFEKRLIDRLTAS